MMPFAQKTFLFFFFLCVATLVLNAQKIPNGFTYMSTVDATITVDLRYASSNNFVGVPIDGYASNKLILTHKTALALKEIQKDINRLGYSLKVFDAYRPQRAVNHFKRWAKDINDTLTKQAYYPREQKKNLFKHGYIASRSGHSRGSTVDLTLIDLTTRKEIDMGFPFDFFGKESAVYYQEITDQQRKNRALLRAMMLKHGFRIYTKEWWHFTLRNEPFPKTYFDFVVE